jgi:hypothetical protein
MGDAWGDDVEEAVIVEPTVPASNVRNFPPVGAEKEQVQKIIVQRALTDSITEQEEELAYTTVSHFTYLDYEKATGLIRSNTYHAIIACDVIDADPRRPEAGYIMYGYLETNKELIVRIPLTAAYDKETLLDWTLNSRRCLAHVISKSWVHYKRAEYGNNGADGYVIIHADRVKTLVAVEELIGED